MSNCIFCSIAQHRAGSAVIWEDDDFISFLDIYPNTLGQALVIPKEHVPSYIFDADPSVASGIMEAARVVAGKLERGLSVQRVNLVFEGLEVNHLHAKLYPVHGVREKFERIVPDDTVYFEKYSGFISTLHGPEADHDSLMKVAARIREA